MHFAFLIDPPHSLKIAKDTSFALMLESQAQGHAISLLERGDLELEQGRLFCHARRAAVRDTEENPFTLQAKEKKPADDFDILFVRTDPPFNTGYLTDTWLLSHAGKRPLVLNSPQGLRNLNEKIWAAQFTDLTPATLITASKGEFLRFLAKHRRVVMKPTDGYGGSAVFVVMANDKNAAVTFETLQNQSDYVIVQEYLSAAEEGDKRILLLEGEILGAVLRLHDESDHRNNFAAGGKPFATSITAAERELCERLKPHLLREGIFLAGIDLIGEKLIEVNVTSPTCLREMQAFYAENLAAKIINAAVAKAEKSRVRN